MWEAYNLVTENRLHSAVSKLGHVGRGDGRRAQLLFRLLVDDVLEQLAADHKQPLSTLSAHQRDRLVDSIRGEVRALLKTHAVHETEILIGVVDVYDLDHLRAPDAQDVRGAMPDPLRAVA